MSHVLKQKLRNQKFAFGGELVYLMSGSPNDGRKDSSRSIVASKTGFAHAGSIVDYKRSDVVVTHDENNLDRSVKNTQFSTKEV